MAETARIQRRAGSSQTAELDHFLDVLWMEKGLSENTLAAYRSDLSALEG